MISEEYKNISDLVKRTFVKLKSYPSISIIKNKITNGNNFKFEQVSLSDIEFNEFIDIRRAITAERLPLHMASSQAGTWKLWFPSASC